MLFLVLVLVFFVASLVDPTINESAVTVEIDAGSSTLTSDHPRTSRPSPTLPETSRSSSATPIVSLDAGPFTEHFNPLSDGADEAEPSLKSSTVSVTLSDEQRHILSLAKQGKNIFFTGSAGEFQFTCAFPTILIANKGTGKSVLLREIIEHFGGRSSEGLAITASVMLTESWSTEELRWAI